MPTTVICEWLHDRQGFVTWKPPGTALRTKGLDFVLKWMDSRILHNRLYIFLPTTVICEWLHDRQGFVTWKPPGTALRTKGLDFVTHKSEVSLLFYFLSSCTTVVIFAFDEGERILILPWAQAGCQIDLRDFRPGDRLPASTSCATVSDMVTKLCFSCAMMYNFALVSMPLLAPWINY